MNSDVEVDGGFEVVSHENECKRNANRSCGEDVDLEYDFQECELGLTS